MKIVRLLKRYIEISFIVISFIKLKFNVVTSQLLFATTWNFYFGTDSEVFQIKKKKTWYTVYVFNLKVVNFSHNVGRCSRGCRRAKPIFICDTSLTPTTKPCVSRQFYTKLEIPFSNVIIQHIAKYTAPRKKSRGECAAVWSCARNIHFYIPIKTAHNCPSSALEFILLRNSKVKCLCPLTLRSFLQIIFTSHIPSKPNKQSRLLTRRLFPFILDTILKGW